MKDRQIKNDLKTERNLSLKTARYVRKLFDIFLMKNVKLEIKTVIRSRTARSVIYGKDRGNMIWLSGMLQTKKEKEVLMHYEKKYFSCR